MATGGGLYLSISAEGRRRWVFLFTWNGKLREAGLGSAAKGGVSLKAARDKAAEGRALVMADVDPIAEWNGPEAEAVPTFGGIADEYVATHKGGWRNEKHAAQCTMTLTTYCGAIRKLPVDKIDTEAVLSVLKSLWGRAPETASRLRGRIEAVLDAAKAKGDIGRNEANPARRRGHLDKLLPKRSLRAAIMQPCPTRTFPSSSPSFASGKRQRRVGLNSASWQQHLGSSRTCLLSSGIDDHG
jgi:hypothetical protein